jgi:hypothetical protein
MWVLPRAVVLLIEGLGHDMADGEGQGVRHRVFVSDRVAIAQKHVWGTRRGRVVTS